MNGHDDSWKRNSNLEEYVTNEREGAGIGKLICSLRGEDEGNFNVEGHAKLARRIVRG